MQRPDVVVRSTLEHDVLLILSLTTATNETILRLGWDRVCMQMTLYFLKRRQSHTNPFATETHTSYIPNSQGEQRATAS